MATIAQALEHAARLHEAGQLDAVESLCRQILQYDPAQPDALHRLGLVANQKDDVESAIRYLKAALERKPRLPIFHVNLGVVYNQRGKAEAAVEAFQSALRLQPDLAEAHNGLGSALATLGEYDQAVACFQEALRLQPAKADAHKNLACVYMAQRKHDLALASFDEALRLKPNYAEAHKDLGLTWMALGQYEKGWQEYEWRWLCPGEKQPEFRQPRWDGSPLAGRRILLYAEQGLGDTIHFIRYARLVKERGGKVLVSCPVPLMRLLARSPGIDQLIPEGDDLPDFDLQIALGSLPGLFHTTPTNMPADVPYVFPDEARIAHWRRELPRDGLKVGIAWQGNPKHGNDHNRSFPLKHFEPLAEIEGVRLISLQKSPGSEQLPDWAGKTPVLDLGSKTSTDFEDTAALIKNLDLIISADTAIVHVAGALAVPVWVALPKIPDWRWWFGGDDSPWYPTMRLFRQKKVGEWGEVFGRIKEFLENKSSGPVGTA